MHALPPAPAAPPRRQLLVGTTIASLAAVMVIGGMLALYIRIREDARDAGESWVPQGVTIPGVATNVMLISFFVLALFGQFAVYAARRRDRQHLAIALGLVALVGFAIINAQIYVYSQMDLPIVDTVYAGLFFAVTGAMLVLVIFGVMFTAVTAFRALGGRDKDHELVAAHALYWYVLSAIFSVVWLVVYVSK